MSNVTPIYNAIISELETLFPTKTRIQNPYSLTDNMSPYLVNGWGVKVGGSSPSELVEYCSRIVDRTFTFVLTRELIRLDNETPGIDTMTLAFIEDINSLEGLMADLTELDIPEQIAAIRPVETSGIQQMNQDKFNFLTVEASFIFTIRENL